jgi:class II lanthipeptide synthase
MGRFVRPAGAAGADVNGERGRFLETAERIGRRLCRDAVWANDRCNWLGWALELRGGQWVAAYRAMGSNLYDGTSGIGLFLATLASATGDPIIRDTARAALAQALTSVDGLAAIGEYGFYSGLSGIAWAFREGGRLLEDPALAARGEATLLLAAGLAPNRQRLDVMNGSAGLIPVLLKAAEATGGEELTETAMRRGEHLLALAKRGDDGWSWETSGMPNERNLLGFAHGASGIACALAALGRTAGRADFVAGAREAVRYERSHFRPAEGNWPDLRSFGQPLEEAEAPCMVAWCHGAPGIGMARLRLHGLLPDEPALLEEALIAVRTTTAALTDAPHGIGNFSLCHGNSGNADFLITAAGLLGRSELRGEAESVAIRAIGQFEEQGLPWPCGVPGAGETPNLFLGLAGIGYFLLRLYDSGANPTILLPAASRGTRVL